VFRTDLRWPSSEQLAPKIFQCACLIGLILQNWSVIYSTSRLLYTQRSHAAISQIPARTVHGRRHLDTPRPSEHRTHRQSQNAEYTQAVAHTQISPPRLTLADYPPRSISIRLASRSAALIELYRFPLGTRWCCCTRLCSACSCRVASK